MRNSLTGLVSAFRGLAGAAGIGLGVTGIARFLKGSLDAAGGLGELSEQLGISAEALQTLQFAASQSGIKTGELESGMQIFSRTIGDAAMGTKTAAAAFARLGVDVRDANGQIKPTEMLLRQVANGIAAIEDPARRASATVDLFGRSGQRLLPILSGGAARLDDFESRARALGLVLSNDLVAAADAASDQLSTLHSWATKLGAIGTINLGISVGLIDASVDQQIAALRKRIAIAEAHGGVSMLTGDNEQVLRHELDLLLELKRLEGQMRGARDEGGDGDGGGGRAEEITLIDSSVSSLTAYLAKMREEVDLLRLSADEREVEIAVRAAQDEAMKEGSLLTAEQTAEIRELVQARQQLNNAWVVAAEVEREAARAAEDLERQHEQTVQSMVSGFTDITSNLASSAAGFRSWKDTAANAITTVANLLLQFAQQSNFFGLFGGGVTTANLGGSAPGIPPIKPMASGGSGIVTKPTLFMAGEAGAEAFAFKPLGQGGDGSTIVNVYNNSGGSARTSERQIGNMKIIDVTIDSAVAQSIATRGKAAQAMESAYGLKRQGR